MASIAQRVFCVLPILLAGGCAHGLRPDFSVIRRDLGPCGTAPGRSSATAVVLALSRGGDTLTEATATARLTTSPTTATSQTTLGPFSPDPVHHLRIGPLNSGGYRVEVSAPGYASTTTMLGVCGSGEVWYRAVLAKAVPVSG